MSDLAEAKKRLIEALGEEPWLTGIGIGLVGAQREKGLIVSVRRGAPENTDERIAQLVPGVAFQVRSFTGAQKRGDE